MVKRRVIPSDYAVHRANIGAGSYGVVSVLRHRETGQLVARKRLKTRVDRQHGVPLRVLREISLLQRCKHPNLVTLLEAVMDEEPGTAGDARPVAAADAAILDGQRSHAPLPGEGVGYLFFEYVEYTLAEVLREAGRGAGGVRTMLLDKVGARQIRVYSRALLQGLAYLHEQQVLHLDVKPDNLLITQAGVLKLADFGFAREVRPGRRYSPVVVTATYRAPEIFAYGVAGRKQSDGPPYDDRADAWSAGCVIAEMYTCQHSLFHPVRGERSDAEVMHRVLELCGVAGWTVPVKPPKRAPPYPQGSCVVAELAAGTCNRCALHKHRFPPAPPDAQELVGGLLQVAVADRLAARDALQLPYFAAPLPDAFPPNLKQGPM
eukprot:TRINITY_DN14441_c0_g1_i1.p1 TRINITY_DN14441_c0_g1~~TRINITY_DN14441_c0_g1_i1.p1  ORF type:complete len:377 (+),score=82.60 TRINITY_DN14441_c0_g1_i1:78-1208(+)